MVAEAIVGTLLSRGALEDERRVKARSVHPIAGLSSSVMREVTGDIIAEGWPLGFADRDRLRAARMERAAGRRINRVGRLAGDRRARASAHRKVGHGVEEHARIGMAGPCEQRMC